MSVAARMEYPGYYLPAPEPRTGTFARALRMHPTKYPDKLYFNFSFIHKQQKTKYLSEEELSPRQQPTTRLLNLGIARFSLTSTGVNPTNTRRERERPAAFQKAIHDQYRREHLSAPLRFIDIVKVVVGCGAIRPLAVSPSNAAHTRAVAAPA